MKVQVTINNVKIIKETGLNENEYNIHEFEFDFVEEYEGLTKKAVFTDANEQSYIETIVNNKCSVPTEVLHKNEYVTIGVYAYEVENEELKLRYSPQPTHFFVNEGSYKSVNNSTPPTPSEIEQLQSQITQNSNDIDVLEGNILNLQEEQVEQNRNIQANADDIEEIQQEQITQNTNIQKNTDDIVEINQNINEIDGHIDVINQNIDNLEQDLTNYSLITETGSQINLNVNSTNYQITAILKDKNGNVIYTSNAIDLPIESMIINASYDNTTKEIVLTLQNGNTLRISIADLISGLVSETQLQTILANYYTKTEVDNLLSAKANQTSLDTTNQNVTSLAERVSTNETDIANIKEEQTTQNTNIEELQSQVETLQEDLESANAEIEELNTDITNMAKAMYKVDGQGSDIILENTSENKFVEFGLEGRTEQEQLDGKNFFNVADIKSKYPATLSTETINNILDITANTTVGAQYIDYIVKNLDNTKNYTISFKAKKVVKGTSGESTLRCNLAGSDDETTFTNITNVDQSNPTQGQEYSLSYVLTGYNTYRFRFYNNLRTPVTEGEKTQYYEIQLEEGSTATSYEPYCGGIPAPNPDFPQQIKNVTGNANVKIQNKNLFDKNNFEYVNGKRLDDNGNVISDDNSSYSLTLISVKPNTTYTIQGTQSEATKTTRIYYYNNQKQFISRTRPFNKDSYSFTTLENCNYIGLQLRNSEYINVNIIQLEEGSTATSYVPHQEQNYPFTFAEGQRGMQGTTLEDDGIHQKRKQIAITETMIDKTIITSYSQLDYIRFGAPSGYVSRGKINSSLMSCANENKDWSFDNKKYIGTYTNRILYNYFYIGIPKGTTYDEIKDKIIGQILEYEVTQEEKILYNATQQAQYNAIKEATSYDDITYITSVSDELGFDMNVVAVADANKVIDNQNNEIDTIKSRLDLLEG